MGRNWSLYMAELYRSLFEEFDLKKVDFDVNDNTLDFVVDTGRSRYPTCIATSSENVVIIQHPGHHVRSSSYIFEVY